MISIHAQYLPPEFHSEEEGVLSLRFRDICMKQKARLCMKLLSDVTVSGLGRRALLKNLA